MKKTRSKKSCDTVPLIAAFSECSPCPSKQLLPSSFTTLRSLLRTCPSKYSFFKKAEKVIAGPGKYSNVHTENSLILQMKGTNQIMYDVFSFFGSTPIAYKDIVE